MLFCVVAAVPAATVLPTLGTAGFFAPGDESAQADRALEERFPAGPPNLVLLVTTPAGVQDAAAVRAGEALTARLSGTPGVGPATSYWTAGRPDALRSADGREALVLARLLGDGDDIKATMRQIHPLFSGDQDGLRVQVGGQPAAEREIQKLSRDDLTRAELLAAPLLIVLLVLVFGSVIASLLPGLIGLLAVFGTFAALRLCSAFTDVSIFSLNLATALSLGLAIDYSLFILARYREELGAGRDRPEALETAVRTAGRTVLFSAVTVAVSLAGMALFPLYYLRSFAYAGIAVVLVSGLAAVVVLPAVLAVLGPRVDRFDLRFWRRGAPSPERGAWRRIAEFVMRRPVTIAVVAVVFLLALGVPFLRASFQLPDDRMLPASSEAHRVAEAVRSDFPSPALDALYVTAEGLPPGAEAATAALGGYATALSRLPDVASVTTAAGVYAGGARVADAPAAARFVAPDAQAGWVSVVPTVDQYSAEAERLVRAVRAVPAPFTVQVGGNSAHLVDTRATLGEALPWVLGVMIGAMLVLLFLFTGSVLIPIKAVLCNLLSLTATFGALVWVFSDGHFAGLLGGFQVTGQLEIFTPILMLCIAFGLSMDYEVFLVSRIQEAHQSGLPNDKAIADGLQRTGRLVTSAAALLIVVLLANVTSQLTILKMLGLGLGIAILVDATVVRAFLVPAVMRLAGSANWWAPRPLRRFHERFGLREAPPPALATARVPLGQPQEVSR
ncbi:membrane protein [Phytohabitans rumicis]|uniref:Membrane protein n=2 Tax=Phytohabitans rumicis TaxID=1076125 RepID=A0A6V8LC09_9ACTN|nr:membrane protein [Phytohabitans rumicis]